MGRLPSGSSFLEKPGPDEAIPLWPFGKIEGLGRDELRETAYELFFACCRSSPGFGGGRTPPSHHAQNEETGGGGKGCNAGAGGANMVVSSKIKRALGLRTRKASPPMRAMIESAAAFGGNAGPGSPAAKGKQRPMTSAEIMRRQMGVTDECDARLRKTLTRTLVGVMSKRAETIILPLELLRQLRPSEFASIEGYHCWQRRQLKVLQAGLILHPSTPLESQNPAALHLQELLRSSTVKPIDTIKHSESMRALCSSVTTLAWRSPSNTSASEACHWADGYPLNVHLYLSLIRSIFDLRDETVVLDEVDELMELMKKTWTTLGINRMIHNACFTWALFEQYLTTGQVEQDLLCAVLAMLVEVARDVKRVDRDPGFVKIVSAALASMQEWAELRLSQYHDAFDDKRKIGVMENVLCLALAIARISEDVPSLRGRLLIDWDAGNGMDLSANLVDQYIRCSSQSAFNKVFEKFINEEDTSAVLIQLAKETESLAVFERNSFSRLLKRWHPVPVAAAVTVLHNCYGIVLKQYMERITGLMDELMEVLDAAGRLEKALVRMAVEDSVDCDGGGKEVVGEMIPYDVENVILSMMKNWIADKMRIGRECLIRAKETESWNPKSKSEPFAQSAEDLVNQVKMMADEFFEIAVAVREELIQELVDGLEELFQDYTSFVSSCGSKQNYIPALPPLTRCNQDTKLIKLLQNVAPGCSCSTAVSSPRSDMSPSTSTDDDGSPSLRPSTSRGTQRLYVRLNTLHYLLAYLHSLDKSLSLFSHSGSNSGPRFGMARSSIQSAILHVSGVAAYRLVFCDSSRGFYEGLYVPSVAEARIEPSLCVLRQNLAILAAVLTDGARTVAEREVMKASFAAFLMVLLAGGSERAFSRTDHEMIAEDFEGLKRVFDTRSGEWVVVEREAEVVEEIVELMGTATERLVEEFTTVAACEASGYVGLLGLGVQKLTMPPTTGRWNRCDPNTVLRVLCHRNEEAASCFLKKTFQLPKRR